jgi:HD-GYP domain-containing protein (c-di-GMP phosphodiesterase class II)
VPRAQRPRTGEELLAPFRVLAGGEDLATAGVALLERACRALEAVEGALLLDAGDGPAAGPGFVPGPRWGRAGPAGRLGQRPGDGELASGAATAGRPVLGAGPEVWCAMVVEGQAVGVLALRRAVRPFAGPDLAAVEILATGAALAADRLRFLHRWSRKLEQADAAHSQLLRYADDLRTTFSAERRRAEELRAALDAVELAYTATVRALASAVEAKDAYTGGHLTRVTAYGIEACRALGGDLAATPGLEYAFLLHDLGKIGVPDAVLNKAGPLTDEEWALMREHPAIGLRILEGVPHMDVVRAVVYSHHERWDGAGYPEGLKDEQIPLAARVFAAVDAFDAITTDRPYRAAVSLEEALHRLREASGTQFAPDAVEAIHLVERGRLAAIQATANRGR